MADISFTQHIQVATTEKMVSGLRNNCANTKKYQTYWQSRIIKTNLRENRDTLHQQKSHCTAWGTGAYIQAICVQIKYQRINMGHFYVSNPLPVYFRLTVKVCCCLAAP